MALLLLEVQARFALLLKIMLRRLDSKIPLDFWLNACFRLQKSRREYDAERFFNVIPLGLLAIGFFWGCIDALRKVLATSIPATQLAACLMLGQLPFYLAWVLTVPDIHWSSSWLFVGTLGVISSIVSLIWFLRALSMAPISTTIPLLSLTPVWASLLAWLVFNEIPTAVDGIGILLIVLGAIGLHTGFQSSGFRQLRSKGALYMLGVTLLWSASLPIDKLALLHRSPSIHALLTMSASAIGLFVIVQFSNEPTVQIKTLRKKMWMLLLTSGLYALAMALQFWALSLIQVGTIESVKRGVGMAMALLSGLFLFSEQIRFGKVIWVLMMTTGVVVLLSF